MNRWRTYHSASSNSHQQAMQDYDREQAEAAMNTQAEYKASDDILGQYANANRSELFEALGAWIDTAALYARNADYWRERALKAEGEPDAEIADWGQ